METGRVLDDRYELLGPLAEGASSTVWEARDRETGDRVAVKAVSLEQAGWRAEVRDRFQREARLLTLVRHRHVVGVRAHGETDDGYLYLVLDLLSGETLAHRLARPPRLTWREAAAIALELGRGLGALHARGVVHRDLKPANVMLHAPGTAAAPVCRIIDLGISKVGATAADPALAGTSAPSARAHSATLTATGQVLGTPEYMSHEQALGERDIDARADVWALGVVLHEMLTGRRPFAGANVNAVLAAIRRGLPVDAVARDAPEPLARVVARCLDRSRDRRYPDGEALADALVLAVDLAGAEETRARRLRRVRRVVAGGAALLVAGAALAFPRWGRERPHTPGSSGALLPRRGPVSVTPPVTTVDALEAPVAAGDGRAPSVAVAAPLSDARGALPAGAVSAAAPLVSAGETPRPPGAAPAGRPARVVTRVNSAGF